MAFAMDEERVTLAVAMEMDILLAKWQSQSALQECDAGAIGKRLLRSLLLERQRSVVAIVDSISHQGLMHLAAYPD